MFKSITVLGHDHPPISVCYQKELFLYLAGIFYLSLLHLSVSTELHAESRLNVHNPMKIVAEVFTWGNDHVITLGYNEFQDGRI